MQENTITTEYIEIMVIEFYSRIIEDEKTSKFFIDMLDADMESQKWQEHIKLITNFLASTVISSVKAFKGSPFAPNACLAGLQKEIFEQWLTLLNETATDIFDENGANTFKELSKTISADFMKNLGV